MALVLLTMQKNIHASFKLQYFNVHSDSGDSVEQGIKVGDDSGVYRTIIMMQLPEAYDVYSVVGASSSDTDNADGTAKTFGYVDPNVVLKDVELKIKTLDDSNDGAGGLDKDNAYLIRHLKQDPNYKFVESVSLLGGGIGLPTHDSIEQDFTASSTLTKPYFGKLSAGGEDNEGDIRAGIDYTTDFGYGATGVIDFCLFPKKNTEYTFSLAKFIKSKNLTWGDKVTFVLEKNTIDTGSGDTATVGGAGFGIPGNTHDGFIESQDGWSTTKGFLESMTLNGVSIGSVKHQSMDVTLFYDDPEPARPVIELTPDDDMVSGVITLKSKPSERDIVALTTIFTTGAATTIGNAKGVVYSSSNRVINYGINGDTLKQSNSEINSGFLSTADTPYNIAVYAEDNVNKVSSNMITHERMSCSGSVSPSPPTIGQTATLTVSGTLDGSAKEFSKVGVNWDGNATASNDSLEDYDIITLDSSASSTTLTHTYDKSKNAYKVNVFVVDDKGFRSDFTQAASLNVAEGTPVAKLRLSKETVMVGDQADELSVVTASAAQSYTVGSDKQLFAYIFGCTGSDIDANKPVTTYPTANNNTGFSESSKKVRLKANVAACDGTTIRVYGRISVDSSGGNIVDTDSSFSHYEQKVIQLTAHADADKDFTAGSGWVDGTNSSSEFFKSVEFVVCSARDHPEDITDVYYSLGDTSGNIINNQIRVVEENSDPASAGSWGGYLIANVSMSSLNINGSNNTITRGGGSGEFISNGLAIGDKIYISAPEDAENNSFFTVTDLSSTVITVVEPLTTNSNDGTAIIYKVNGPTLSFTALDEMTATVDLRVADTFAAQSTSDDNNVSAAVTQDVKFKEIVPEQYLDLDTISDAGEISIQAANISRSGGLASNMALGNSRYPTNAFRTKLGKPVLQVQLRILTQAGYRRIWSLIEGDRYIFSTIDLKKIDSPAVAYKQVRLRLENGTINKDPSMASQYVASLNFVIIGELYDPLRINSLMATVEYVIPDGLYTRLKINNHIASGVSKILLTHNVNLSRYLTVQFSGEEMAERCHLGALVEFEYHRGIPNTTAFKDDKKFIGIIKSIAPTDSSVAFTAFDYTTFLAQSQHVLYKPQDYVGEDLYYAAASAADYKGIDTSTLLQGTGIKITEDMDLFGWKTRKEFIDACFNELRYVVNDTAHPTNTVLQWNYAIREGKTMDFYLPDSQSSGAIPATTVSYNNNNIIAEGLVSKIDTSKIINSITVASSSDEKKYVQLEDNDSIQKYGVLSTFISYASTSTSTLNNVAYEVLNRFSKPSYTYNVSLDNADYLDLGDMIALDVPALEKEVIKPIVGYQLEFSEGIKTRYTIGQKELSISEYIDLLSKPTNR